MKPDLLDQSFLRRLQRVAPPPAPPAMLPPASVGAGVVPPPVSPAPAPSRSAEAAPRPLPTARCLLDRLLAEAPREWVRMADCVEEAAARGRKTIAVTGGRRGEGRTTVVQGLARLLGDRGRTVICVERGPGLVVPVDDDAIALVDDAIVLVDAGIWFPPGPLRCAVVERAGLGCDAVITVRRACQAACAARANVVEAAGLEFLGEVVTFSTIAA